MIFKNEETEKLPKEKILKFINELKKNFRVQRVRSWKS